MDTSSLFKAFSKGFEYGSNTGQQLTIRSAEELFPNISWECIDAARQGSVDGVLADTFRLSLVRKG